MNIKVPDYTPSERQTLFHTSTAFETLYGGAAGGGKTAAIVAEALTYALENKGARVYMFRKTLPEIEQSITPEFHKQAHAYIEAGHMKFNGKRNEWTLTNGSIIRYAYLQNAKDKYKYQSAEMHLLIIDELTHFAYDEYEYLRTRVRGVNSFKKKIMAATNPGGIGHGWVKSLFIDPSPLGERIIEEEIEGHKYTRQFIPAKVSDHPDAQFRQDYERVLGAIKDPSLRKALKDGDWNVFAGQVFKEWRSERHTLEPFAVPEHWQRWTGYDHGYNTQAAMVWFTRDPQEDRTYIYREMYVSQMGVSEIANTIRLMEQGENISVRMADPAIWKGAGNQNTGETVAKLFEKEGIHFTPANNDRIAGKQQVHGALSIAPDGKPKLRVFSNCTELIRTLPDLPYDQHRVEDVDTKAEDHLYDAMRYGLMSQTPSKKAKIHKPRDMVQRKASLRRIG